MLKYLNLCMTNILILTYQQQPFFFDFLDPLGFPRGSSVLGVNLMAPPAPPMESGNLKMFVLLSLLSASFAISTNALSTETFLVADVSK